MTLLLRMAVWQVANAVRQALRDPRRWGVAVLLGVLFLFQARTMFMVGVNLPPEFAAVLRAHLGIAKAGVFLVLCLMALSYLNQGLSGGVLSFSAADGAYLFPAPVGRQVILLAKLPGALGPLLLTLAGEAWAFRAFVWLPLGGGAVGGGWAALTAAVLCVGGWLNLAVAVELIFGAGRYAWWQKALNIGVFVLVGAIALACWRSGLSGLEKSVGGGPLTWLFWPCALAARAAMAPLLGASASVWTWPALGAWYSGTMALLFARRDNYYEAAARGTALLQSRREARQTGRLFVPVRARAAQTPGKISLPAFGTGGIALLWAHLAAATKRPLPLIAAPLAGGIVAGFACVWAVHITQAPGSNPDDGFTLPQTVQLIAGMYIYAFVFTVGLSHYQQGLLRHTLMRPLPLPAWQVVAGEAGARTLLNALPGWTLALTLAILHPRGWTALMLPLGVTLPVFLLCLNLLLFRVALWYPSAADRVQMFTAVMVQVLLAGVLIGAVAIVAAVPSALAARHAIPAAAADVLSPIVVLAACAGCAAMLLRGDVRAYARWEPAEGSASRRVARAHATFRAPSVSQSKSMSKKIRPLVFAVVVVLALLFAGGRVAKNLHKPPPPPHTAAAHLGNLVVSVSESGTVQPVDKVDVKSKVGGRLLSVPITEGERVKKGQLIATVDRSQIDPQIAGLRAQLAQAQARLQQSIAAYNLQVAQSRMAIAQARATLQTSQTHLGVVAAPARSQDLAQQQQAVERAQIELDDARRTRARRLTLLAKGFVAQSDADATQVAVDTAASTLASAQQQLALLKAGARPVDVTDAQAGVNAAHVAVQSAEANAGQNAVALSAIAQSRAAIAQTQNDLAQLEVKLADTRIIAPDNGIVLKKYKQVGEIVQDATTGFSDAQSLVATLGSKLEVLVNINEVDIPEVRVGMPVILHVDALPGVSFAGRVIEIAPASSNAFADTSTGTSSASGIAKFPVKVGLDKDDPRLRPGMTTDVQIISAEHHQVVLVPLEAVPGTGRTAQVTVLTLGGVKQPRTLILGLRNDTDVEVTHGLKPGDQLLLVPIDASGRRKISISGG